MCHQTFLYTIPLMMFYCCFSSLCLCQSARPRSIPHFIVVPLIFPPSFPREPYFRSTSMARPREGNLRSFFDATDLNKAQNKGGQTESRRRSVRCCAVHFFLNVWLLIITCSIILADTMLQLSVEHESSLNPFQCARPNCNIGTVSLDHVFFFKIHWGMVCSRFPF